MMRSFDQTQRYKPNALTSKASDMNRLERDWKVQCDQLYKDIERKEARNDSMVKELQAVRKTCSSLQRELKLLNAAFDKSKFDRQKLYEELTSVQEQNEKLMGKLEILQNSELILEDISMSRDQKKAMNEEITLLNGALSIRESKIEALQKELDIMNRSLQIQNKHQNNFSQSTNNSSNKEILRSLYFDLGKKESEIHNLTLTLSETSKEMEKYKEDANDAITMKDNVLKENSKLTKNNEILNKQNIEYNNTITNLTKNSERNKNLCESLQKDLEKIQKDFTEKQLNDERKINDQELKISQLNELLMLSEKDKNMLENYQESLHKSVQNAESLYNLTHEKMTKEIQELNKENKLLRTKTDQYELLKQQVDLLRNSLFETKTEKDKSEKNNQVLNSKIKQLESDLNTAQSNLSNLNKKLKKNEIELKNWKEKGTVTTQERDESLEALSQTITTARDLGKKYNREKELRKKLETDLDELQKSKANMCTTILDALHRERSKVSQLEKCILMIPIEARTSQLNQQLSKIGNISTNNEYKTAGDDFSLSTYNDEIKRKERISHESLYDSVDVQNKNKYNDYKTSYKKYENFEESKGLNNEKKEEYDFKSSKMDVPLNGNNIESSIDYTRFSRETYLNPSDVEGSVVAPPPPPSTGEKKLNSSFQVEYNPSEIQKNEGFNHLNTSSTWKDSEKDHLKYSYIPYTSESDNNSDFQGSSRVKSRYSNEDYNVENQSLGTKYSAYSKDFPYKSYQTDDK